MAPSMKLRTSAESAAPISMSNDRKIGGRICAIRKIRHEHAHGCRERQPKTPRAAQHILLVAPASLDDFEEQFGEGSRLEAKAYDAAHQLHAQRKLRTFNEQFLKIIRVGVVEGEQRADRFVVDHERLHTGIERELVAKVQRD